MWYRFGIKGLVDVTVELKEKRRGAAEDAAVIQRVPLELKTGKMFRKQGTIEHRAQVSSDREYVQSCLRN